MTIHFAVEGVIAWGAPSIQALHRLAGFLGGARQLRLECASFGRLQELLDLADRYRKVEPFAFLLEGIDADQPAAVADQGAARIAGIDRRLGLNDVGNVLVRRPRLPFVAGANLADDAFGVGPGLAGRMADGMDVGANLHLVHGAEIYDRGVCRNAHRLDY